MKKIFIIGGLITLFAFVLIALPIGRSNANGKTVLTYLNYTSSPDHTKDLEKMVTEFEKENPDISIDIQTVPFDTYFTKLQTLVAAGQAPDVFELNYENFVTYAKKGALLNLNKYVQEDKNLNLDDVNMNAFDAFKLDGNQFGMTEDFSNVVTFYNKDMFDKAGLAYPTSDWKWADEAKAAEKLTDLTNKTKPIWGTYSPVTMNEFYKVAAQNSGKIYTDGKLTINSPQNVEALEHMTNLVNQLKVSPSPAQMSGQLSEDLFLNGQLAMVHTGIWDFAAFKDAPFKWDIAVEAGNTQKATHFFADGISVAKDTKNADAAYKFASFMSTNEEVAKIRIAGSWNLPIVNTEEVLAPYLKQTPPANRQAVFDSLKYLILPPVSDNWQKLSDATDAEFQKVLNGQENAKQALNTIQKEFGQ